VDGSFGRFPEKRDANTIGESVIMRKLISSGSQFERIAGYSRAVVEDGWVFVSGTTGFDYAAGTIAEDVVAQADQAIRNIAAALAKAEAGLEDVVRLRAYLTQAADFEPVSLVFGRYFGEIRPASTVVVCQLIDPRMKIEIEVTARLKSPTV
jgi:enamine deaminase RidA (YjgF/YER057c/UK114 family)